MCPIPLCTVYLPEFQPNGPVINANLFSPEATLATSPLFIGFLNGASSLARFGLTDCDGGFAEKNTQRDSTVNKTMPGMFGSRNCGDPAYPALGQLGSLDKSSSDGALSFAPAMGTPASQVVAELDMLLTAGRLAPSTREVIEFEYEQARDVPTYRNATSQTCGAWGGRNITSVAECQAAARELGFLSDPLAVDDGRSNSLYQPTGCYYESESSTKSVVFNEARDNQGACKTSEPCLCAVNDEGVALSRATTLLMTSAEFHVTNAPQPTSMPRQAATTQSSQSRPFKAIVVLFLKGGLDSWNLFVPSEGCGHENMTSYAQYQRIRSGAALPQEELHPVHMPPGSQAYNVCSTFGVHPNFPALASMYAEGEALLLANTGTLVMPLTKEEFKAKGAVKPRSLFAHNVQQQITQSVHAQSSVARGVLGRMLDILTSTAVPYSASAYSLAGLPKLLDGGSPPFVVSTTKGAVQFLEQPALVSGASVASNPRRDRIGSAHRI